MAKAILIYGTTTGSTETLAEAVVEGLNKGSAEVTLKNVTEADVDELRDHDLIVLGCSTWGEGELQDDFVDFHNEMKRVPLAGKKVAVFGPGDKEGYPDTFCAAVDMLEERLRECGAQIVVESLKVDGDVEPAMGDAESWGLEVAKSI